MYTPAYPSLKVGYKGVYITQTFYPDDLFSLLPQGEGCCSQYSTTFHYLSPHSIYMMEQIIYRNGRRALPRTVSQGLELPLEELKTVSY